MSGTTLPAEDYLLSGETTTLGVKVRCACGPVLRSIPLHMTMEGIAFYRRAAAPADLVVQSWRCSGCKRKVKITAQMLYLAA